MEKVNIVYEMLNYRERVTNISQAPFYVPFPSVIIMATVIQ